MTKYPPDKLNLQRGRLVIKPGREDKNVMKYKVNYHERCDSS